MQSLRDVVVAIMIEKHAAVEHMEEILAVPGVDMVQWGPADYTMSSGRYRPGQSPDVSAVERTMIETALRMGVAPRVELTDLSGIEPYLELGVKHFRIGDDMSILRDFWEQHGRGFRELLPRT